MSAVATADALSIYQVPEVSLDLRDTDELNEAWWIPLAVVLAYWGSAWAFCTAVCWGRVRSCEVKWYGYVKAVCR